MAETERGLTADSCHGTKSLRDSGGCGLVLTAVPEIPVVTVVAHASSHTSRAATSLKTKIIRSGNAVTRESTTIDCLDEQIKKVQLGLPRLSKSESIALCCRSSQRLSGTSSRTSCRSRSLATRNSLKSWMGQNVNSPFSNIRAVTFKLCLRSTRIALGKSSGLQLTPVTKTP